MFSSFISQADKLKLSPINHNDDMFNANAESS